MQFNCYIAFELWLPLDFHAIINLHKFTMESMANFLHITPSYFCRCFKDYTHQTFKEYVVALRLDYAMRQINTTDRSITEICYESGFSSSAYFSKVFTKRFGKNPTEIRKEKGDVK